MKLRTEGVAWQELDGELVVLDLNTSRYLSTNRSGAVLAEQLREDRTLDDLARALVEEFDVDAQTAHDDALAYVESLRELDLLVD